MSIETENTAAPAADHTGENAPDSAVTTIPPAGEDAPETVSGEKPSADTVKAVFEAALSAEAAQTATEKKRSRLTAPLIVAAALLLALGAALGLGEQHYKTRFLPGTELMGVDCSGLTTAESEQLLRQSADALTVTLRDGGGEEIVTLPLTDFLPAETLAALPETFFRQQTESRRPLDWLGRETHIYTARPLETLSLGFVRSHLRQILYGGDAPVSSRSARLVFGETGYTLEPETQGTAADILLCARAVTQTLRGVDSLAGPLPEAVAEGGLIRPTLTADSPELEAKRQVLDDYISLPITLDFQNGNVYTLSAEDIWSVTDFTEAGRTVECAPVLERVRALTDALADQYASLGVDAKFQHVAESREYCYYRVGDKGWILNRDALAEDVYHALCDRRGADIVPEYDRTWYWKNYYRWAGVGDTFVEISLDNQYMWVYLDNQLLVETPVVTGSYETWDETRRGCFKVYYKEEDLYLQGPTWYDHVDYWMPFDGGIGLHDSDWRDEYGGDIYQGDGSHGCINTPLEAIRLIYENIKVGDFVIVY